MQRLVQRCLFATVLMCAWFVSASGEAQADEVEALAVPPPTLPPVVVVDAPPAVDLRKVEALGDALQLARNASRRSRHITGWSSMVTGLMIISVGVWRFVGDNDDQNEFQRGLGVMLLGLGGSDIAKASLRLASEQQEETRYRRWLRQDPHTIDAHEVARFEGELRALSYVRERERRSQRWLALARMLIGGAMLALVPVPDLNKESRQSGYIVGGVFAGTGALSFGLSFRKSKSERAWHSYLNTALDLPTAPRSQPLSGNDTSAR